MKNHVHEVLLHAQDRNINFTCQLGENNVDDDLVLGGLASFSEPSDSTEVKKMRLLF